MSKIDKMNMFTALAALMTEQEGYSFGEPSRGLPGEPKTKASKPKGLKEFKYPQGSVWALNQKNADRKAGNKGWIELKDFYYSALSHKHQSMTVDYEIGITGLLPSSLTQPTINGKVYTDCVKVGKTPLTARTYSDLVKVDTDWDYKIKFEDVKD